MKTTDIKIGDLIEFKYDELKLKGLVTGINNDDLLPNNTTFTIRDEDKIPIHIINILNTKKKK